MTAAIHCTGLVRRFGERTVVDGLDLDIAPGEVFGVLGHNGAGKTTTVRLLNGLLTPSAGEIRVLDKDPLEDGPALRAEVGVLTESPAVDPRLTGWENLVAFARLYGLAEPEVQKRASAMLERFGLEERGQDRAGEYSRGMRQRLALARTLLHEPRVLYLDEPTSGLDPVATHELHTWIEELVAEGRTVFLCTHNLAEAQKLCTRVAILREGRKVLEGAPDELAARFPALARHRVRVPPEDREEAWAAIAAGGWEVELADDERELLVRGLDDEAAPRCVAALVEEGVRVLALIPEQASLEEIYLALNASEEAP